MGVSLFLVSIQPTAPQPLKGGFSTLLWVAIQPKQHCETASFAFSFGLSELLGVAVLQCRLGLVRKTVGLIELIRWMKIDKRENTTKRCVRLFLNLSKFYAICFLSANSADYANLFPQPTFASPASFVGKEKVLANGSNEENVFSPFDPYDSP